MKLTEVDDELFQASAECRKLTMEKRGGARGAPRVFHTSREMCHGFGALKVKLDSLEQQDSGSLGSAEQEEGRGADGVG